MRILPQGFLLAALSSLLFGCSLSGTPASVASPEPWRIVPEASVLGERRQFFIYGKGLAKAEVQTHASVTVEKGWCNPDGRALSVYLTVRRIEDDSTALGAKPGARRLIVKTPDTSVTLTLKIVNEAPR